MTLDFFTISNPVSVSFDIDLAGVVFKCEDVVRVVPKKRLVCQGWLNGKLVYAKIFMGKKAHHYALRDKAGVEALKKARIVTPELLLAHAIDDGTYILIYAAIKGAQDAEQVWRSLEGGSRLVFLQKLVQTVAQHHQAGLMQTDLYFKNFLVQKTADYGEKIYTLDGDGIRRLSPFFKKRQKLHNLATLFSKMDVLDDVWIADLYGQYCVQLGMKTSPEAEAEIRCLTQRIRYHLTKAYAAKKVFRTCTDVKVTRSFNAYSAVENAFKTEDFSIARLDLALVKRDQNLKNGNTCTIARAQVGEASVVIKRYNIKNFWHGLNRAFRVSRAAKSWANAHWLIMSGIETPKPVALVEARLGRLRRQAYFVSEYISGPDVSQYFNVATDKALAARKVAALFYKLYFLRISHGDCKASNIRMVNGEPALIDLDGMHACAVNWFSKIWFEHNHVKDLKRFMKNWSSNEEITSLLKQAILREYAANPSLVGILIRAGIA